MMKKFFYSVLAAATMLLATTSCSQEEEMLGGGTVDGGVQKVSFSVKLPEPTASRALEGGAEVGQGNMANTLRYALYEVDNNGEIVGNSTPLETGVVTESKDKEFSVKIDMVKGLKYKVLFLAYNEDNCIFQLDDDDDLMSLQLKDQLDANQESYDAFVACHPHEVKGTGETVVTLTRPFAQINAATSLEDYTKANMLNVNVVESQMIIEKVPNVYNVFNGETDGEVTLTYKQKEVLKNVEVTNGPTYETVEVEGKNYYNLNMVYVLAGANENSPESTHKATFTFYRDAEPSLVRTIYLEHLPIQRNYRTNIIGNLLTQEESFKVVIDANFKNPDKVEYVGVLQAPEITEEGGVTVFHVKNAAQLAWISAASNGMERPAGRAAVETGLENFAGKKIVLEADIDMSNYPWMPICLNFDSQVDKPKYANSFKGTFDGNGKTISNLSAECEESAGLIARMHGGTVKNVILKNVNFKSNHWAGGIVAWAESSATPNLVENCQVIGGTISVTPALKNGEYVDGDKAGGIAGFYYCGTINGCKVSDVVVQAFRDLGGVVGCASGGDTGTVTVTNNHVSESSIVVNQTYSPYEDDNFDTNANRAIGRTIGNLNSNNTIADEETVKIIAGIGSLDAALADKAEADTEADYVIKSAENLIWFVNTVNGTLESGEDANNFAGKTVKLDIDIDLSGLDNWTPIGGTVLGKDANGNNVYSAFSGIFDGGNHTISNLNIIGYNSFVGLFGNTNNGEIKNLTVNNAKISGRLNVGVVAGQPYTSKYTNIKVTGHVEVNGMSYVGGVGGKNAYADWTDITVEVDESSYVKANSIENGKAYRTYVGGACGFNGEGGHSFTRVSSNINVIGTTCDVGGLFGIAHYGNNFINCSSSGNVEITNAAEAGDAEEIGGIAGVWMDHKDGDVTFTSCSFTGNLKTNFTEGVDLSDNTITGKAYNGGTGAGKLTINGKQIYPKAAADVAGVSYATLSDAIAAAAENAVITVNEGTYTFPQLTKKVTLDCAEGTVFEGKTSLNIAGSTIIGAKFLNPEGDIINSSTINGIFKNCYFEGKHVVNYGYASDVVVFENCTLIATDDRVFHFDGASSGYAGKAKIVCNNCIIEGYRVAIGGGITDLEMTDCTITASFFNRYNDATLTNCDFGTTSVRPLAGHIDYNNCTYKGNALTVNDLKFYEGYISTVGIDGKNYAVAFNATELTNAVKNAEADLTVVLKKDITGDAIALQQADIDIVIDGNNHKYDGTIYLEGQARNNGAETLAIKNIKFEHIGDGALDFISCNSTESAKRYAHNVTVENCVFTGNGKFDDANAVVAMRYRQCYNMSVVNCTATGLHSLMWATGCTGVTIDNVEVADCGNGVSFGTSNNCVVKNSNINASGDYSYAIRVDASGEYKLNVENSELKAEVPVLLRKATGNYNLTFGGKNNLLSTKNYQVIVTAGDYEEGTELTKATGNITINGAEGMVIYQ